MAVSTLLMAIARFFQRSEIAPFECEPLLHLQPKLAAADAAGNQVEEWTRIYMQLLPGIISKTKSAVREWPMDQL